MKRFGLILVSALACLPVLANDEQSITVTSSSTGKYEVVVRATLQAKPAQLSCFTSESSCSEPSPGEYGFLRATASDSVYQDCTNVILYKSTDVGKEKVGVYCWENSADCYILAPCSIGRSEFSTLPLLGRRIAPTLPIPEVFLAMSGVAQPTKDMYPRLAKAQEYDSEGFTPIDCFAGQVKVRGKRVRREPFSVFLPDDNKKCCGTIVKNARTDEHGHFLVEPMAEGEYYAQFHFKGVEHLASFAIVEGYNRCGGSDYVQINFSDPNKAQIQESIWINDSGRECEENEPQCYRK